MFVKSLNNSAHRKPLREGMPLRHLGWTEAADLIVKSVEGATLLKCSEFGDAVMKHMG